MNRYRSLIFRPSLSFYLSPVVLSTLCIFVCSLGYAKAQQNERAPQCTTTDLNGILVKSDDWNASTPMSEYVVQEYGNLAVDRSPIKLHEAIPEIESSQSDVGGPFNAAVTTFAQRLWTGIGGPPKSNPALSAYADLNLDWVQNTDAISSLISIKFYIDIEPRGAGHGTVGSYNFNWVIAGARPLSPGDIFNLKTSWQFLLADAATEALRQQSGDTLPVPGKFDIGSTRSGMATIVSDPINWVVTCNGLRIDFNEGDVAGYGYGRPSVLVKWSSLKEVLNRNGLAQRWP